MAQKRINTTKYEIIQVAFEFFINCGHNKKSKTKEMQNNPKSQARFEVVLYCGYRKLFSTLLY